jgi:hypothetical protein
MIALAKTSSGSIAGWLLLGAVALALFGGNKRSSSNGTRGRAGKAKGRASAKGSTRRTKRKSGCGPVVFVLILLCCAAVYIWASHPEMLPPSMR